jgi:hypothetical protein
MLTSEESLEIRVMYIGLMGTLVILYGLYAVRFFEISKDPRIAQTIDTINLYLKNAIIVLLLWYFNPIRKPVRFTEFHRELVFNAAFFLLGSSIIQIGMKFINDLKIEETIKEQIQKSIEIVGERGSSDGNKLVNI